MEVGCKYSDIAYPNTCYHNVLLLAAMIMTSAFMYFFQHRGILSLCTHCGYTHKKVAVFPIT